MHQEISYKNPGLFPDDAALWNQTKGGERAGLGILRTDVGHTFFY
jgi:hypothetical protein